MSKWQTPVETETDRESSREELHVSEHQNSLKLWLDWAGKDWSWVRVGLGLVCACAIKISFDLSKNIV